LTWCVTGCQVHLMRWNFSIHALLYSLHFFIQNAQSAGNETIMTMWNCTDSWYIPNVSCFLFKSLSSLLCPLVTTIHTESRVYRLDYNKCLTLFRSFQIYLTLMQAVSSLDSKNKTNSSKYFCINISALKWLHWLLCG